MRPPACAFVLAAGLTILAAPARADSSQAAVAQELFKKGREALVAGDLKTACPALAESARLERRVGTLISLATCEQAAGRPATARAHWQDALDFAVADGDARATYVRTKLTELEPKVPRLLIVVDAPPPGLVVKRDGVEISAAGLGVALPIDPGQHRIVATAPGKRPTTLDIAVPDRGETVAARLAPLDDAPPADAPPSSGNAAPSGSSTPRTIGWIALGTGAAGFAVAGITGLMLLGQRSTVQSHCDIAKRECDQEGLDAASSGSTLLPINAVAWIIGAVGVGIGGVLLLTSSSSSAPTATSPRVDLRFTGTGLAAQGRF